MTANDAHLPSKVLAFTPSEQEEIRAITEKFSRRAQHDLSVDRLIDKWRVFTREVQQGYRFPLNDYTNDLSVRDLLQELLECVSVEVAPKIEARLAASDNSFESSTSEIDTPLPGQRSARWWHRVPRTLIGDLRNDLSALGVIHA